MARLVEATRAEQVAMVRGLFAEYARLVDEPACFVGFERELETLPGDYRLLLAEAAAGCVAVRLLDAGTAEMKRLYVRSAHRGKGLGSRLPRPRSTSRARPDASASCSIPCQKCGKRRFSTICWGSGKSGRTCASPRPARSATS